MGLILTKEQVNVEYYPIDLSPNEPMLPEKPKAKRGRPRKSDIEAKKPGKRGKVGRPAGDTARMNELKARLLSTSGEKVIDKVIKIALDDEHPGQIAALRLCMDRLLPVSVFEKDAKRQGNKIEINIIGHNTEVQPVEYVEAEINEVED